MRTILIAFVVVLMAIGVHHHMVSAKQEKVVAKIGSYVVTQSEFEDKKGDQGSEQAVLDNIINQKLILLDAERKGLDKKKDFLARIQHLWEQSLLTTALQEKGKELAASSTQVSKKEVQDYYEQMVKDGQINQPLDDVFPQIQMMVIKKKESDRLNEWMSSLRQNIKVEIYQNNLKPG